MANECGRTHHCIFCRQVISEDPHIGWPEIKTPANPGINNHPEIPPFACHELGNLQNRPIALVLFVFTKKYQSRYHQFFYSRLVPINLRRFWKVWVLKVGVIGYVTGNFRVTF